MNEAIFGAALGITKPLYVEGIEFTNDALHIYINFERGTKFQCPNCGLEELAVHDTIKQEWRHMNFFQYQCFLHFPVPRIKCPTCNVRKWKAPWASGANGFTMLFSAFILELVKLNMPVSKIAGMFKIDDMKIWRIIRKYVEEAYKGLVFAEVRKIGIDETSVAKGHKYITVFADAETRTVLFCVEGKDAETVKAFAKEASNHGLDVDNITDVTQDLSAAFAKGVKEQLINATITYDKFHVIKLLNEAVDTVRRAESKENPVLKNTRYTWLKNPGNLTLEQLSKRDELLANEFLKTAEVYRQKLSFQQVYETSNTTEEATFILDGWLLNAEHSGIKELMKFAKTVRRHFDGIVRNIDTGLNSGFLEGINSRIQQIKCIAKGFRNVANFIAMVYLKMAGLTLPTHSF
jgi:transposase